MFQPPFLRFPAIPPSTGEPEEVQRDSIISHTHMHTRIHSSCRYLADPCWIKSPPPPTSLSCTLAQALPSLVEREASQAGGQPATGCSSLEEISDHESFRPVLPRPSPARRHRLHLNERLLRFINTSCSNYSVIDPFLVGSRRTNISPLTLPHPPPPPPRPTNIYFCHRWKRKLAPGGQR